MKPTETLGHEHKIISLVLDGAEREARNIRETGKADAEKIEKMLDFFRNFADKCHHAKEERHLFVELNRRGLPKNGGPIGVMLSEHEQGRALLRVVAERLQDANPAGLSDALLAYVNLLRAHIDKENKILFPMADRLLTDQDQKDLEEKFEKLESEEMGLDTHEKYHHLAHELSEM